VLKRVFRAGHVMVTTVPRVKVKMMFSCLCFNLMQVLTLRSRYKHRISKKVENDGKRENKVKRGWKIKMPSIGTP